MKLLSIQSDCASLVATKQNAVRNKQQKQLTSTKHIHPRERMQHCFRLILRFKDMEGEGTNYREESDFLDLNKIEIIKSGKSAIKAE